MDRWRKITPVMTILLLSITIFAVIYNPGPEVTYFDEASFPESINWITYRSDVRHQGIAPPDSTVDSGLELEWRTNKLNRGEYTASKSSPAVDEENLYIGLDTRALVAVDRLTGLVKWSFVTRFSKNGIHGSPTIDPGSGSIFIGENDGYLYCYWMSNQTERWRFKTGADIKSTASVSDGVVYMTSWDGALYAINITTGKSKWIFSTGFSTMSSPTVDTEAGVIFFGNHGGYFYAVNSSNGDEVWEFKTGDKILSSSTLIKSTGTVIIGSNDGNVYLLDAKNGVLKQKIPLVSGLSGVPVAVGDHLYVFDHLGYLYSFRMGIEP